MKMSTKACGRLGVFVAWSLVGSIAWGQAIPIVNAGFEANMITPGTFQVLVPAGWMPYDPGGILNQAAWKVLESYDRPVLCTFSDRDPITHGGDKPFLQRIPGAAGQPHTTIEGGGHFLQEDKGPELATVIADFIDATS